MLKYAVILGAFMAATGIARAEESRTTIWMGPSTKVTEGAAMIERGLIARGITLTRKAMEDDLHYNDLAAAHNNLCAANLALKLYREAISHCTKAIRLRPFMWEAFNNRANGYFGLAKWDLAIDDYNRAVKIRPDKEIVAFNLYLAMEQKRKGGKPAVLERDG